jgi:hypothetical protein
MGDLGLGDEDTGVKRGKDDDIEIAKVVRDDSTLLRESTGHIDLNTQTVKR